MNLNICMIRFKIMIVVLNLLYLPIHAADTECNPTCTASDQCIRIIQPAQRITIAEEERFTLAFKVGGLDLADVLFCVDEGRLCRSILSGTSITVTGCTTSVDLKTPTLSLFFGDPPDSAVCTIKMAAYGGGPPYGESESKIILKKTSNNAQAALKHIMFKRTDSSPEYFSLSGKRLHSNIRLPMVIIERNNNRIKHSLITKGFAQK